AIFLGDREYFVFHSKSANDELYISAPVLGRLSNKKTVLLSRRLTATDGSYGGVILASLDVLDLNKLHSSIDVGKHRMISLVGFDGIVRAHSSDSISGREDFVGRTISKSKLLESHRQAPQGYFWSDRTTGTQPDDIRRLVSYRALEDLRLLAVVGISESEIFR